MNNQYFGFIEFAYVTIRPGLKVYPRLSSVLKIYFNTDNKIRYLVDNNPTVYNYLIL